jgi:glycosyl transferase family 25
LRRADAAPGTADGVISAAYDLVSFQADPALAIQLGRGEAHGLRFPICIALTTNTAIKPLRQHRLTITQRLGYRYRRMQAQLRMGLRRLACTGRAARRTLPLSQHWQTITPP